MSFKKDILNTLKFAASGFVLLVIIGFTNSRQSDKYIRDVVIDIDNQFENYFINEKDVLSLINGEGKDYLLGSDFGSLNLKELENRILENKYVGRVQAFRDLHGTLTIKVIQNRPIARILRKSGSDVYISTKGKILPHSSHYTARVILVDIDGELDLYGQNIQDTEEGMAIFQLINFIDTDEFWKAQIAGIKVDKNLEIKLMPQVTKQVVEFGKAEDIEEKFKKLKIFYRKILPFEGWNSYSSVNLKYKQQIVCK